MQGESLKLKIIEQNRYVQCEQNKRKTHQKNYINNNILENINTTKKETETYIQVQRFILKSIILKYLFIKLFPLLHFFIVRCVSTVRFCLIRLFALIH